MTSIFIISYLAEYWPSLPPPLRKLDRFPFRTQAAIGDRQANSQRGYQLQRFQLLIWGYLLEFYFWMPIQQALFLHCIDKWYIRTGQFCVDLKYSILITIQNIKFHLFTLRASFVKATLFCSRRISNPLYIWILIMIDEIYLNINQL